MSHFNLQDREGAPIVVCGTQHHCRLWIYTSPFGKGLRLKTTLPAKRDNDLIPNNIVIIVSILLDPEIGNER